MIQYLVSYKMAVLYSLKILFDKLLLSHAFVILTDIDNSILFYFLFILVEIITD